MKSLSKYELRLLVEVIARINGGVTGVAVQMGCEISGQMSLLYVVQKWFLMWSAKTHDSLQIFFF